LVEHNGLDAYGGHVFVFLSKRMTRLKAITGCGGFVDGLTRVSR